MKSKAVGKFRENGVDGSRFTERGRRGGIRREGDERKKKGGSLRKGRQRKVEKE